MNITKRNGEIVEFNKSKVVTAINKAFLELDYNISEDILEDMVNDLDLFDLITVEEIQDQIEDILIDWDYPDVSKAYSKYRGIRQIEREKLIEKKLRASEVQNQNANVDEASFGGRIGEATRVVTKDYALKHCVSEMARENHENNMIYIHDLDSYAAGMHNCLTLPIDDLLKNGAIIKGRTLRPAGGVGSACQLLAVYFQTQSLEQFGGVAAGHFDWTLVPYVRKSFKKHYKDGLHYLLCQDWVPQYDKCESINCELFTRNEEVWQYAYDMTKKEIHQGIEALYHNLNTLLSRSGNQLPFSSINYGTCTLPEGQMVIEELLKCSIEGIGIHHTTSIFPCGIFQYMKGVNDKPGTPNYYLKKLAIESTAKRLYPNYANVDWSVNAGYDKNDPRTYMATMGL